MSKKRNINESTLYDLYISKDMTSTQVAKILSSSNSVVCRELNKYELITLKRENKRIIKNKRMYRIWQAAKSRCLNVNDISYKNYGLRGITICDEWKNSFAEFYKWSMGHGYDDKLTIDRIDCSGNYTPSNCRWVCYKTQNNNKRDNLNLVWRGEKVTVNDIHLMTGLNKSTIRSRLSNGWSLDKVIETPRLEFGCTTVKNKSNSKMIWQLSVDGDKIRTFNSIREASECLKIDYSSISLCLRKISKTSGGFRWEYT